MFRSFEYRADVETLRLCMQELLAEEGLSHASFLILVGDVGRAASGKPSSHSTLLRFINGEPLSRSVALLKKWWNFISSEPRQGKPDLRKYLARHVSPSDAEALFYSDAKGTQAGAAKQAGAPDEYCALLNALVDFLVPEVNARNFTKLEALRRGIAGDYVMYRPFMGPLEEPILPNGLIRATQFRVHVRDEVIVCEELQNFPESSRGEAHIQKNDGILFPYGDRIFWIMRGQGDISFKVGVVENMHNWSVNSLEWFKGRLFVVSNNAIYPTVRLCCVRNRGDLKTGYLLPQEISHPEARAVFKDLPVWSRE